MHITEQKILYKFVEICTNSAKLELYILFIMTISIQCSLHIPHGHTIIQDGDQNHIHSWVKKDIVAGRVDQEHEALRWLNGSIIIGFKCETLHCHATLK